MEVIVAGFKFSLSVIWVIVLKKDVKRQQQGIFLGGYQFRNPKTLELQK